MLADSYRDPSVRRERIESRRQAKILGIAMAAAVNKMMIEAYQRVYRGDSSVVSAPVVYRLSDDAVEKISFNSTP